MKIEYLKKTVMDIQGSKFKLNDKCYLGIKVVARVNMTNFLQESPSANIDCDHILQKQHKSLQIALWHRQFSEL